MTGPNPYRGTARALTAGGTLLGEGPVWEERSGRLLWVDIWGGLVHSTDLGTGESATTEVGAPVSSVVPSRAGSRVVTIGCCVVELVHDGPPRHLTDLPEPGCLRANDAAVDPAGRLWVGTMAMPHAMGRRAGSLWRLELSSLEPVRMLDDVLLGNGLGWSPDGRTFYFVDSGRRTVTAYPFEVDTGALGEGRTLMRVPADEGMPDGLEVDTDGCLWVALAGCGMLGRWSPDGDLLERHPLPVDHPTSCCFAGPGLDRLVVTTGSRQVPREQRAAAVAGGAGALHELEVAARGLRRPLLEVAR